MRDTEDHYNHTTTNVDSVLALGLDPLALIEESCCNLVLKGVEIPLEYVGRTVFELSS